MKTAAKVRTLSRAWAVESWATEPVPPLEREAYWRAAVAAACGGALQLQSAAPAGVTGALRRWGLPQVQLAHVRGAAQRLGYGADSPYPVLLVLDAQHEWEVQVDGADEPVRPGQVAILRAGAGLALDFRYGIDATLLFASAPWVQRWLRDGGAAPVRICADDHGWGRILATVLRELAQDPEAVAAAGGTTVADVVGSALAAAQRSEPAPRFSANLFEEARRLSRERLGDAQLHAREVAQVLGVSVRTLSRAFEEAGTTFAESLREMRLEHAAALLAEPELAHLGVAQVGHSCGFVSASHFVREYRRRWGITPGQARAGSAATQAGSELAGRLERVLADTRMRIEAQKGRIARMAGAQTPHLPESLELLHALEASLATLERMQRSQSGLGER